MSGIRYKDHLGNWQECPMEEVRAGERVGIGVSHMDYAETADWQYGSRPFASIMEMGALMRERPGRTEPAQPRRPSRAPEPRTSRIWEIDMGMAHWHNGVTGTSGAVCGCAAHNVYGTNRFHSMLGSKVACPECSKAFLEVMGEESATAIRNTLKWKWTPEQKEALAIWRRQMGLSWYKKPVRRPRK